MYTMGSGSMQGKHWDDLNYKLLSGQPSHSGREALALQKNAAEKLRYTCWSQWYFWLWLGCLFPSWQITMNATSWPERNKPFCLFFLHVYRVFMAQMNQVLFKFNDCRGWIFIVRYWSFDIDAIVAMLDDKSSIVISYCSCHAALVIWISLTRPQLSSCGHAVHKVEEQRIGSHISLRCISCVKMTGDESAESLAWECRLQTI